jgi:muconolactone delta-isomerase
MKGEKLHDFMSWMTAKNWASRDLARTGKPQAIYRIKGKYKHARYSLWKVMKPGKLCLVVQRPDPMFDCLFKKGGGMI